MISGVIYAVLVLLQNNLRDIIGLFLEIHLVRGKGVFFFPQKKKKGKLENKEHCFYKLHTRKLTSAVVSAFWRILAQLVVCIPSIRLSSADRPRIKKGQKLMCRIRHLNVVKKGVM